MTIRAFRFCIAILSTCMTARVAHAQESPAPTVDPAVETVVSGGAWSAGAAHGRYRVVVVMQGWETIRRRAVLQWVQESESPDSAETVRASQDLTDKADVFSLGEPLLTRRGGRWYVSLAVAERPLARYSRRVTFELGPPGTVRQMSDR